MSDPAPHPENSAARQQVENSVEATLRRVGKHIVLGLPLGLGKPNYWVNELYRRVREDASLDLTILTGLTLQRPRGNSELERRFLAPLAQRWAGDWPDLLYALDRESGRLPSRVKVVEFYLAPGRFLGDDRAQRDYLSTNYTAVARDALDRGLNVFAQSVALREVEGDRRFSLSSNPDITFELLPHFRRRRGTPRAIHFVGQVQRALPFFGGDAELDASAFDEVLDHSGLDHSLYGIADEAVSDQDWGIALRASALIADGGTLQLGIGSLADAVASSLLLRHRENSAYSRVLEDGAVLTGCEALIEREGGVAPFQRGLYASTEMYVRGFQELLEAGILSRQVYDHAVLQELLESGEIGEEVDRSVLEGLVREGALDRHLSQQDLRTLQELGVLRADLRREHGELVFPDGRRRAVDLEDPACLDDLCRHALGDRLRGGHVAHGCFFLGPQRFYDALRTMPDELRDRIGMTSVSRVNQIQGAERLRTAQRQRARFLNTAMKATCLGAVCSDALESGRVVSGVGGQQDFVMMAHDLPGARSVLMVRAARTDSRGRFESNVVWSYGHVTVPRQQRDLLVTEYGIADLRGRTDEETTQAMIQVADSRAQPALVRSAVSAGKLAAGWQVPARFRDNLPDRVTAWIAPHRTHLPRYPFGTDLDPIEQTLGRALRSLQGGSWASRLRGLPGALLGALRTPPRAAPYLQRMGLESPLTLHERLLQKLVVMALVKTGSLARTNSDGRNLR